MVEMVSSGGGGGWDVDDEVEEVVDWPGGIGNKGEMRS